MLSLIKDKALNNQFLTTEEALSVLTWPAHDFLSVVQAARDVREKFFGKKVKLNYLVNVKSGICPEDCHYCSQSKDSNAPIEKYNLMDKDEILRNVERGLSVGAKRACLVASGRGPSEKELGDFCGSVEHLKEKYPNLEVCACMGLLQNGQADQLKKSGVHAYNHNINTSRAHYEKICGTHTYNDRIETLERVKQAGMSSCSGVLAGMGETNEDLVEMAMTLREKNAESIPVNFLISIDRTPLENTHLLSPIRCLLILAMYRLTNPAAEIRIAGGREVNLRSHQSLGLMIANSIFIGDYLTTQGQAPMEDLQMIDDLGYDIWGQPDGFVKTLLKPSKASLKARQPASV